ncbi:MAG: DUF3987 domain-containing protein [Patescibacteria group bacterium]|nr:DUF3987 domain-containing protein [Patescibacteria group bacterium]
MDLLREVPEIKFGPDSITWQSAVTEFAAAAEMYTDPKGLIHTMSAITFASGELGNLLDPQDKAMINLLITLWDGKKTFEKKTKTSGNDRVENPWINMIAATTPHWIADNMPANTVGGGFTSRCIFIYAEHKERYIPYPKLEVNGSEEMLRLDLIDDLNDIALNLCGEFQMTKEAVEWGMQWYQENWTTRSSALDDERLDGYVARKQTHLHKLAMVLSAARSNDLIITQTDLQLAEIMLKETEDDLSKVFSRIGRTPESLQMEQFLGMVKKRHAIPYDEAYRIVHSTYSDFRNFEGALSGAIRAGYLDLTMHDGVLSLVWKLKGPDASYHL